MINLFKQLNKINTQNVEPPKEEPLQNPLSEEDKKKLKIETQKKSIEKEIEEYEEFKRQKKYIEEIEKQLNEKGYFFWEYEANYNYRRGLATKNEIINLDLSSIVLNEVYNDRWEVYFVPQRNFDIFFKTKENAIEWQELWIDFVIKMKKQG